MQNVMRYRHVFIGKSALDTIRSEVQRTKLTETGGPLVGYISNDGALVVTHANGPGPRAELEFRSVLIDGVAAQQFCDNLARLSDGKLDYVGDWHCHPGFSLLPSDQDLEAMKLIANAPNWSIKNPVSLIYRRWPERYCVYTLVDPGELILTPSSNIETIPS
jgi:integrative and conjugative element protein (TIGR02256 family)